MQLPSFAKINLCLHVLGRREDGFHEIETIFQQVSLSDEITFQPKQEGVELACDHPDVPTDERNLCIKAANLLQCKSGKRLGCTIDLKKQIPVSAGLGGGSSNAATTLLGLNILWNLGFSKSELVNISSEIGSDVPFFIEGGMAIGTGRGEVLKPLSTQHEYWCLIISPSIRISSKWAYQTSNFNLTKKKKNCKLYSLQKSQMPFNQWNWEFHNDLEPVVFTFYPQLKKIKDRLEAGGAFLTRMTGSGSSIFGLFQSQDKAEEMNRRFDSRYKVYIVKPIKWGYETMKSRS